MSLLVSKSSGHQSNKVHLTISWTLKLTNNSNRLRKSTVKWCNKSHLWKKWKKTEGSWKITKHCIWWRQQNNAIQWKSHQMSRRLNTCSSSTKTWTELSKIQLATGSISDTLEINSLAPIRPICFRRPCWIVSAWVVSMTKISPEKYNRWTSSVWVLSLKRKCQR